MTAQYLNAADHAAGFNFVLAGWARSTGSAQARVVDITGPSQRAFQTQTSGTLCCFYNTTAIATPVASVGFTLPSSYSNIQNQHGVALIDGATGNGYGFLHNGGNPGTLEIRTITATVLAGTALASVAATTAVIDDVFRISRDQVTGEMLFYQNEVLKLTHTDDTIPDVVYPAWISLGASSNIISMMYEAVGGSVVSLTDPLVMGEPLTLVTTRFPDITSISGAGLSAEDLDFIAGTTTGNWPAISESITPTVYLPATGVTITVSDGSNPTTIVRDIDLAAGWASVEFGTQIDEPDYLLADVPIESGNRAYYETNQPTVGNVVIYPDGSVYSDAGGIITLFLHKLGDPLVQYNVTAPTAGGGSNVPPVMPADTSVSVQAGETTLGTFLASSGTAPITYSLTGTSAGLFNIDSSTAVVTFISLAVVGSGSINVVATNAEGSDSQTVDFTVTPVLTGDSDVTLQSGRVEAREQLAIVRVKLAHQADSVANTVADLRTDFNSLLSKMDTRGWFTGGEVQTTMLKVAMQNGLIQFLNRIKTQAPNQMDVQSASVAADVAALRTDFNALLTKLKEANLMATS